MSVQSAIAMFVLCFGASFVPSHAGKLQQISGARGSAVLKLCVETHPVQTRTVHRIAETQSIVPDPSSPGINRRRKLRTCSDSNLQHIHDKFRYPSPHGKESSWRFNLQHSVQAGPSVSMQHVSSISPHRDPIRDFRVNST
jgi:hypothetical protein